MGTVLIWHIYPPLSLFWTLRMWRTKFRLSLWLKDIR
ncbi:hypothetical protein X975_00297, partial [Stegodyphus mimosarum]